MRALVCAPLLPEYDRERGSQRVLELIGFLKEAGWAVNFIAGHAGGDERYRRMLQQRGVAVYEGLDSQVDRLIAQGSFDLAIIAFWHFAEILLPRIRRFSPQTKVVVDSIDLHFLRDARRIFTSSGGNGSSDAGLLEPDYGLQMVREINTYMAADGVLAVSHKEASWINDLSGHSGLAHYVPLSEELPLSPVPFEQRRGLLFLGNFRHLPNREAVEFLCTKVIPLLDPQLLLEHPLYIVGNALSEKVRNYAIGVPGVKMVGWVPSVTPYLHRTRASVVPLLHGAGVKGKVIQSLMSGTPVISTTIGVEGLDLRNEEEVAIADDGPHFAAAIARLLHDAELWQRLSSRGRSYVTQLHSPEAARACFTEAISTVLSKDVKSLPTTALKSERFSSEEERYQSRLTNNIRNIVDTHLPADATVVVVSKGDDSLLKLGGRTGWHFPQTPDGKYVGYHPADSVDAIQHLEELRDKGADYLLFPGTSLWWLEHYADFKLYLDSRYRQVANQADVCAIYALSESSNEPSFTREASEALTTVHSSQGSFVRESADRATGSDWKEQALCASGFAPTATETGMQWKVLLLAVCSPEALSSAEETIAKLSVTTLCQVTQHWVVTGAPVLERSTSNISISSVDVGVSKHELLNQLLSREVLLDYDFVIIVDGPVVLTSGFLDEFVTTQAALGFGIAQPAKTSDSQCEWPILEQQLGVLARQTTFVGGKGILSLHRSVYDLVFPLASSTLDEEVHSAQWHQLLASHGLKMGIIDATPILLRPESVDQRESPGRGMEVAQEALPPRDRRFTVLDAYRVEAGKLLSCQSSSISVQPRKPRISVVIATYNRRDLLDICLQSFVEQTISADEFEVIVVDDGSTDSTPELCQSFLGKLPLRYFRLQHAGRSAAKNLGIFAAAAPLLLLFDDDDAADRNLLSEHLSSHEQYPAETVAVLGYTTWSPALEITPLMHYITEIGQHLFSYPKLQHGQLLGFTHFWEGRLSCKKALLVAHGVHNQRLEYTIDIELGYRLSGLGLQVVFNRRAISYMVRDMTYDEFRRRCVEKGKAHFLISKLHPDSLLQEYCGVESALQRWENLRRYFEAKVARVHQLERLLAEQPQSAHKPAMLEELNGLYGWTLNASVIKGIVEGAAEEKSRLAPHAPSKASNPLLTIVMPAYNVTADLAEMTARNIDRILQLKQTELEVILIDNGSPYDMPYGADRIIRWPENRGIASAWNKGADLARGEVLCFINTDVCVAPGWDEALCKAALQGRRIAFPYTDHGDGLGARQPDTAGTAGWCFALARRTWEEIGRFDESFTPAFFEDTDYFHRAWQIGVELSPVPEAIVSHVRRTTARRDPKMDWLFQSHRLKYAWKHGVDPNSPPPFYLRKVTDYTNRQHID